MKQVKFQLKCAGYCTSHQHHAVKGMPRKEVEFVATYGYIWHPEHGHILIDTGYTDRYFRETKNFPNSIYAKATPVFIKKENEAVMELQEMGISADQVSYIIITHYHADHIAGLRDFPNATFISSKKAYSDVKNRKGINAVRKAFLPGLLPNDFQDRLQLIDFEHSTISEEHLGELYDVFDDGTILLCKMDGHAAGQIGALINSQKGKVLMVADGAWLKENYQEMRLPNPIVRLFFDSWKDFKATLERIHNFYMANPNVPIIPCHCKRSFDAFNKEL